MYNYNAQASFHDFELAIVCSVPSGVQAMHKTLTYSLTDNEVLYSLQVNTGICACACYSDSRSTQHFGIAIIMHVMVT